MADSRIITLARERGSTATTRAGAMRWLKAHLGHAHPGLIGTTPDAPLIARCYICGAKEWEPCRDLKQCPIATGATFHLSRKWAKRSSSTPRDKANYLYTRRGERCLRRFGLMPKDDAEAYADSLTTALIPKIDYPYRTSESPGSFSFRVLIGERPGLNVTMQKEWGAYSKSCRYPAMGQHVTMTITVMTLQLFPSLTAQGDDGETRLIFDAEPIDGGYRVKWGEQTRGLKMREVSGYMIGTHLIEAESLAAAQRVYRTRAAKTVRARLGIAHKGAAA